MLTEFAAWWVSQMLGLLPKHARSRQPWRRRALIVEPVAGLIEGSAGPEWAAVALFWRGRRGERPLGTFALDDSGLTAIRNAVRSGGRHDSVVLRAPRIGLLEQLVVLPLAAEQGIGQVLLHDMDRLTPFRADELVWDWTIERRDRTRLRLHVRLALIVRARLDPLLRRLGDAAISPAVIETMSAAGAPLRLAVGHLAIHRRHVQRRAIQAAAAACATLAAAAIALPFVLQSLALAGIEERIAALQPAVAEAEALRRRIAGDATGTDAIAEERARTGGAVAALAAITKILPDTTYLSDLNLTQRQIAMTGQSGEAASLIPALSGDPAIRNPNFTAPVTRSPGGADLFTIRAELAP